METYLPFIKAISSEWYHFTLENPLYAAALASAVWLLTAMLYSIRIASMKKARIASENISLENLGVVQQLLQHNQEALAAVTLQMEQAKCAAQDETQRALKIEQLVFQRNQQIAGVIQALAINFDLGERPLLASEDLKADPLWQQHDKVIIQLTNRLRAELQEKIELQKTCKAETAKLAEKEALLVALQTTLSTHSNQLSKLEQAFEQQKSILQQQNDAQQELSDTLKKYQQPVVKPVEPEPEPEPKPEPKTEPEPKTKPADALQQPMQLDETPVIEVIPIVRPEQDNPPVQAVEPVAETVMEHIAAHENEPEADLALPVKETQIDLISVEKAPAAPSDIGLPPDELPSLLIDKEQQLVDPPKGSLGKIKNLFGKPKQQPVKTEPKWSATKSAENQARQLPDDELPEKANKASGKLKGFYSKLRSKDK